MTDENNWPDEYDVYVSFVKEMLNAELHRLKSKAERSGRHSANEAKYQAVLSARNNVMKGDQIIQALKDPKSDLCNALNTHRSFFPTLSLKGLSLNTRSFLNMQTALNTDLETYDPRDNNHKFYTPLYLSAVITSQYRNIKDKAGKLAKMIRNSVNSLFKTPSEDIADIDEPTLPVAIKPAHGALGAVRNSVKDGNSIETRVNPMHNKESHAANGINAFFYNDGGPTDVEPDLIPAAEEKTADTLTF